MLHLIVGFRPGGRDNPWQKSRFTQFTGRCLMARPRLILFDEPSLGLAPTVTETVFQIIAGIQREGTTVLMVEQNAYKALQLAGRAYVMETGRITLEGPAKDLMQNDHVKKAYLGG